MAASGVNAQPAELEGHCLSALDLQQMINKETGSTPDRSGVHRLIDRLNLGCRNHELRSVRLLTQSEADLVVSVYRLKAAGFTFDDAMDVIHGRTTQAELDRQRAQRLEVLTSLDDAISLLTAYEPSSSAA